MDDRFELKPDGRDPGRRHPAVVVSAAVAGLALLAVAVLGYRALIDQGPAPDVPGLANDARPNIVVIVTDDQRSDTLWAMPIVKRDLIDHGITFNNGFVVNPACCPSRASLLTGQYSHSTGVYTNTGSEGGFRSFNDGSTIATWLDLEYTSVLVGKYLNNYEFAGKKGQVPLGWDHWVAFPKAGYKDFALNIDGEVRRYGDARADYSTDVLADEAVRLIRVTDGPLFMYFAPKAPHWPAQVVGQDKEAFEHVAKHRPPSFNEADVSDKPAWVVRTSMLGRGERHKLDEFRTGQLQTLQPVDRAVGRIVDALEETGRLQDTMIVFTSDNGMMWGEHRLRGKGVAYEESIRVPFVVRYDAAVGAPASSDAMVLNIDIAPTAAALAGVNAPRAEGRSLLPLLRTSGTDWREDFLVEHFSPGGANGHPPTFCTVRTDRWKLTDYYWGKDELYDLANDRLELNNRIYDPSVADVVGELRQRLAVLCNPRPPKKLDYYARG